MSYANLPQDFARDPRSKILRAPESLEDWELISIILGSGTRSQSVYELSKKILDCIGGMAHLPTVSPDQLRRLPGMGESKVSSLIALSEIALRIQNHKLKAHTQSFPLKDIYHTFVLESRRQTRESFYLGSFAMDGRLLSWERMAKGSLTEVGIYKRDILESILKYPSKFCLLAHNHPGQSFQPSEADEFLYLEMHRLLQELEILCIDHWILGEEGMYSCRLGRGLSVDLWKSENIPQDYGFLADI